MVTYDVVVKKVIDGESFDGLVTVDYFGVSCASVVRFRLNGIRSTDKQSLKQSIEGKEIVINSLGQQDSYGRYLVELIDVV